MFINFCNFMGFYMLLPTMSLYLAKEGCPEGEIGLVIGSFTVFSIVFRLVSAALAKRFGAVRIVRCGLLTIAVGTLFFFLIHKTESYIAARLLQGAGFGATSTLIISIASEIIPPYRMAEGLGYMGLGNTLAMALGPLAGMFLSSGLGFEFMFSSMSLFSLLAAAVTFLLPQVKLFYMPEHITKKQKGVHSDKRPLAPASLAIFYGMAVTSVTAYLAVYADTAKLPTAALFFLVSTTGTVVARLLTGKVYDHRGDRVVIPPAILFLAGAFLLILHAGPGHIFSYYAASVVYGFAIGSLFPSIQTLTISSVPHSRRTIAVSIFFVCFDLGTGLGALLLGLLAARFNSYRTVFDAALMSTGIIFIGYAFFYLIPSHRRMHLERAKEDS
jgi:MFS family permease